MPIGVLEAELASDRQEGYKSCAYGVCGLGGEGGRRVGCGVVLGCGYCAVVGYL